MQTSPIIPAAFTLLVCLLVWLLIGSRGKWWLKLVVVAVSIGTSWKIWSALDSYLGYPKEIALPKLVKAQTIILVWASIREPDDFLGDPGAIYLWTDPQGETQILERGKDFDPQALKLPYTRQLHQAAQSWIKEILSQDGEPITLQVKQDATGVGQGSMSIGPGVKYDLPKPKLPQKVR